MRSKCAMRFIDIGGFTKCMKRFNLRDIVNMNRTSTVLGSGFTCLITAKLRPWLCLLYLCADVNQVRRAIHRHWRLHSVQERFNLRDAVGKNPLSTVLVIMLDLDHCFACFPPLQVRIKCAVPFMDPGGFTACI